MCMHSLSRWQACRPAIMAQGGIPPLVRLLHSNTDIRYKKQQERPTSGILQEARIQKCAATALANMADGDAAHAEAIVQAGAIKLLALLLRCPLADAQVGPKFGHACKPSVCPEMPSVSHA